MTILKFYFIINRNILFYEYFLAKGEDISNLSYVS